METATRLPNGRQERENLKDGEKGYGWTGLAACTWQSKEAINHEDNASSPLSEPQSLGWRVVFGGGKASDERGGTSRRAEDKQKVYGGQRREGPGKK